MCVHLVVSVCFFAVGGNNHTIGTIKSSYRGHPPILSFPATSLRDDEGAS
jgi:hypothetical protein